MAGRTPNGGETVVAVVTLASGIGLTADMIVAHCRERVAEYKVPRAVTFGEVPRNATGKVQKHLLRS